MNIVKNTDCGLAGRAAEKKAAGRMGGSLQPGSGALEGAKADFKIGDDEARFLVENKTTIGDSFSVKKAVLQKVYQEALEQGRSPALAFQFVTGVGNSEKRDRWVALPEHVFMSLVSPD